MKAIINETVSIPINSIEDGFTDYYKINGEPYYGYMTTLRCPFSNAIFEKLSVFQVNEIIINKIEYFNDVEELIGTSTQPLILKELFKMITGNNNFIIAKLYPEKKE